MSKQAIIELLNSNAAKYRRPRFRKAKSELLMQLMELTGFKASKSIIRYYSRVRKRRRIEKRVRLPKLTPNDIELGSVSDLLVFISDLARFKEVYTSRYRINSARIEATNATIKRIQSKACGIFDEEYLFLKLRQIYYLKLQKRTKMPMSYYQQI